MWYCIQELVMERAEFDEHLKDTQIIWAGVPGAKDLRAKMLLSWHCVTFEGTKRRRPWRGGKKSKKRQAAGSEEQNKS